MAKREPLKILMPTERPTAQTGQAADELPATGRTIATGFGLKESEHDALKAIADEHGLAVNAVGRFAIRFFILAYRAGKVSLDDRITEPPKPKRRLRM